MIYGKLSKITAELQKKDIKKSGENKFAKFKYFELADFLPTVNDLCFTHGVYHKVDFIRDETVLENEVLGVLEMFDTEDGTCVQTKHVFPAKITAKGMNEMQTAGAVETYARRYLYVSALGITDGDVIDALPMDKTAPQKPKQDLNKTAKKMFNALDTDLQEKLKEHLISKANFDITSDNVMSDELAIFVIKTIENKLAKGQ